MREWTDILAAYRSLSAEAKPCALATVVGVDGSAYRRPGARMLIAEDGRTWGGVSGGCLERDVAERARGVIAAGRPFLQRYDTSDEELIQRGVSTGCGGTIEVFIQALSATAAGSLPAIEGVLRVHAPRPSDLTALPSNAPSRRGKAPISADYEKQRSSHSDTRAHRVALVVAARGPWTQWIGTAFDPANPPSIPPAIARAALAALPTRWQRIACEEDAATADLFIETLTPPQRLVIVGGGADAVPVVAIAKTLGWHVAVVAARPAISLASRFAAADERYVTPANAPLDGVPIAASDAVVVMTHNLARDAAALAALTVSPRYLGLLGPRHRTARVLAPLPTGHPGRHLHSPVGLDIGSETPEEIALSIVAQVQASLRRTPADAFHPAAACAT